MVKRSLGCFVALTLTGCLYGAPYPDPIPADGGACVAPDSGTEGEADSPLTTDTNTDASADAYCVHCVGIIGPHCCQ